MNPKATQNPPVSPETGFLCHRQQVHMHAARTGCRLRPQLFPVSGDLSLATDGRGGAASAAASAASCTCTATSAEPDGPVRLAYSMLRNKIPNRRHELVEQPATEHAFSRRATPELCRCSEECRMDLGQCCKSWAAAHAHAHACLQTQPHGWGRSHQRSPGSDMQVLAGCQTALGLGFSG